ncbi:MAG: MBL fold metallo-hydrolase [Promethearchaeota archaeon]
MTSPIKVTGSIYLVGSDSLSGPGDCHVYAVGLPDGGTCLIDTGTSNADEINYDHVGAAHEFKKMYPDAIVIAHELEVDAIQGLPGTEGITAASWYGAILVPVNVDDILTGKSGVLNLGSRVFHWYHTPGHTQGSISIVVEDEGKKVLFGQDIHGPFMSAFRSNIEDWARSMKMLMELDTDILCEGHFGVYRGKDKVRAFITRHLKQNGF